MGEQEKTDLLVFGDTAIDYFYEVEHIPEINNAAEVSSARQFYGGMGANTAVVARALGLKTGLVSVIGTDAEDYRKYMENLGIKLFLKGIFGDTTKSIFFKDKDNIISFFYKGVTEKLDELDFKKDLGLKKANLENSRCVYLARTYLELQRKVSRHCKKVFVVYNPGYGVFKFDSVPEIFYKILKNTDILVLNHHELAHLNRIGFRPEFSLGPRFFIITRGSAGCRILSKKASVDIPAYKTTAIDAAGAGDAFNAGLITGQLKGFDIYESARLGNAAASFIVESWGCQTNLPTWEKVIHRRGKTKNSTED